MNIFNSDTALSARSSHAAIWSDVMLSILQENYLTMTDDQLSIATGVKLYLVRRKMRELNLRRPKNEKPKPERLPRPPKTPKPKTESQLQKERETEYKRKLKKEQEKNMRLNREMEEKRRRRNVPLFETKTVDLTGMHSVRVDEKTWIYVKPGDDVEALKAKYTRHLTSSGLSKIL